MAGPVPALGLEGRVVIVTGAAGGIGGATARLAVQNGMRVVAVDIAAERLRPFVTACNAGDAMVAHVVDIADTAAIPGIVGAAVDRFGRVDALVHAAAILKRQFDIESITEADWNAQVNVNQRGAWFLVREVAEALRRQGGGGSIVMFASPGALNGGLAGSLVYSVTKGAVMTMVRGFARTYAQHGIRVNAISPGPRTLRCSRATCPRSDSMPSGRSCRSSASPSPRKWPQPRSSWSQTGRRTSRASRSMSMAQ